MQTESELSYIIRKSKYRPSVCRCSKCKAQCTTPCLGTPTDIMKLVEAGYVAHLKPTLWYVEVLAGLSRQPIGMVQLHNPEGLDHCIMQDEKGLCKLHDLGLKPTEGKLSYHKPPKGALKLRNPRRNLSSVVANTWVDPKNQPIIANIISAIKEYGNDTRELHSDTEPGDC